MLLLVDARDRTFPPALSSTWDQWLPADEAERGDARVWNACEHLALYSPRIAAAVAHVWSRQRGSMAKLADLPDESTAVDALQALVAGLTTRVLVDADFDQAAVLTVLTAGVEALGGCKQRCLQEDRPRGEA